VEKTFLHWYLDWSKESIYRYILEKHLDTNKHTVVLLNVYSVVAAVVVVVVRPIPVVVEVLLAVEQFSVLPLDGCYISRHLQ